MLSDRQHAGLFLTLLISVFLMLLGVAHYAHQLNQQNHALKAQIEKAQIEKAQIEKAQIEKAQIAAGNPCQ